MLNSDATLIRDYQGGNASRRVASRLRPLATAVFRGRFDNRLPISEIVEVGPTLKLRQPSGHYQIGRSDLWVAKHILRWIPGAE